MPNTLSMIASTLNIVDAPHVTKQDILNLFQEDLPQMFDETSQQVAFRMFSDISLDMLHKLFIECSISFTLAAEVLTLSGAENDVIQDWINEKASL